MSSASGRGPCSTLTMLLKVCGALPFLVSFFVLVSQTFIIVFDFIILAVFSADKSHLFEQVEPLSLLRANKEHHYIVSWRVLVYLVFLVSHSLHPF